MRAITPGQEVSDGELVERVRRGSRWAEEMLYRRHCPYILGLCTRLLRCKGEADDVVQDAFVSAFERLGQLQDTLQFRSWLTSIAIRQAHRRLRRRKFQALFHWTSFDSDDPASTIASMAVSPEWTTELGKLDDALKCIRDTYRIPWQLRYVEGYRIEEVAALCACSLATAKRRIAHADLQIRKYVNFAEDGHD